VGRKKSLETFCPLTYIKWKLCLNKNKVEDNEKHEKEERVVWGGGREEDREEGKGMSSILYAPLTKFLWISRL
jgi:hypothetical protein